ncbi:MAG TPA: AMP-binding protein [Polyangiaceae bacterium]|jgi:crotonobetaine/carnitine-CoA ligase
MAEAFPGTIPELLAWRAGAAHDAPGAWLFFEGDSWTLPDVAGQVDRFAVGLAGRGVVHGDRVALLLGNRPEALFAWLGANALGAIAAPFNHALKAPELAALLLLTRPRVLVVGEQRELAEAACARLDETLRPALLAPDALTSAGQGAPRARVLPDDVAVLIATSGTTGAPKAVMQTHRTYTLTAEAFPAWLGLTREDRLLATLPFFHINAQAYSTMGALGAGAGLALLPRFSASRFWQDARRLGATQVNAVGAMLHILLKREPAAGDREHALRVCYAALALPEEQHRAFERRFGVALTVGYGMSETTFGTVWPLGETPRYGSMGRLRQHPRLGEVNRARVVRDDGSDAADGEAGELWLANPATMKGYWDDPAQTAAALAGGWLHTGDLVRRDAEGFYTFVARKKEMLRRRGENVAAAEIENVLLSHPSVGEAAAVGAPSELGEDEIVAYVAPREGATIDVAALRAWAGERLADFKVPSRILVRASLPRTATERVAKHKLR